jgi:ABC-type glycerol-3-phosphate transport system substrate-binding protein
MKKKLSRRDFLRLSAAAGAGAALTAYGLPVLAQEEGPVDLRFIWWGGQLRADITTQVIQMFVAQHPNVNFTYEFLSFNDYWTLLTAQAAGAGCRISCSTAPPRWWSGQGTAYSIPWTSMSNPV